MTLEVNAQVETRTDAAARTIRARRTDVFDVFLARGALSPEAHGAVRRLQADIACLHRTLTGGVSFAPRVDVSRSAGGLSEARLTAGRRIQSVLGLAGPASAKLLAALCETEVVLGRSANWREVVARETGERLADAQGAILRAACENLAGAYRMLDRAQPRL
jgi:hypothetical protein